ncbi:MAG: MFS transporter, partial [Pseudomonadota bacterium]
YGLVSLLATQVDALGELVALRFAQGLFSAAPAVFAPGIIRVMFDERGAIKAIGILSSIESLTPALAPIAGVWLLHVAGWQASFSVIAVLAAVLSVVLILLRSRIPNVHPTRQGAGYVSLLTNAVFMRYALSQALTLGALLVFVFGAPAVITLTMGGTLTHFIIMQVCGIATFIIGASSAERFVGRFCAETMIWFGSTLSLLGIVLITGYALLGFNDPRWLALLFVPMNFGLGLRGPPGFLSAVLAADGDDARGSALVILFVLLVTAGGTAFAAPLVDDGLRALALVSVGLSALSLVVLWVLPKRDV